jgi:hypothetical protein
MAKIQWPKFNGQNSMAKNQRPKFNNSDLAIEIIESRSKFNTVS